MPRLPSELQINQLALITSTNIAKYVAHGTREGRRVRGIGKPASAARLKLTLVSKDDEGENNCGSQQVHKQY